MTQPTNSVTGYSITSTANLSWLGKIVRNLQNYQAESRHLHWFSSYRPDRKTQVDTRLRHNASLTYIHTYIRRFIQRQQSIGACVHDNCMTI